MPAGELRGMPQARAAPADVPNSVIRLADVARHGGRAADAVSELWPLITRLEARIAAGHAEPETMRLLVDHQLDDLARGEVLTGGLVGVLGERPDQVLEDLEARF